MSEVVQEANQEFWLPPSPIVVKDHVPVPALSNMAEACSRCGTEFLLGSKFCHSCGRRRAVIGTLREVDSAALSGIYQHGIARFNSLSSAALNTWRQLRVPSWLHYFYFQEIKNWVGLSTASLIAFVVGIGCMAGALLVGLLAVRNFADWQAIQFYRAEWLLAATASFVAGILLKKSADRD